MVERVRMVVSHELRLLRRDQWAYLTLILMPLVLVVFTRPAMKFVLAGEGYKGANGAEQAVPGMAVMFAFFVVGHVGFAFFRDYNWSTWDRLRATGASMGEIVTGRVIPYVVVGLLQQAVLFGAGRLFFGLHVSGPVVALAATALALSTCVVALGLLITSISQSEQQVIAFQTLGTLVFAGIGGALTPIDILPAWIRAVARVTPSYWAMRAYRSVILDGTGIGGIALPLAVLLGMALVVGVAAVSLFAKRESPALATA
jgi:ABC-2 type transport system permease protein